MTVTKKIIFIQLKKNPSFPDLNVTSDVLFFLTNNSQLIIFGKEKLQFPTLGKSLAFLLSNDWNDYHFLEQVSDHFSFSFSSTLK